MTHSPADWSLFQTVRTGHGSAGVGINGKVLIPPTGRDYEVATIHVGFRTSAVVADRFIYITGNAGGSWELLALCTLPLTANHNWVLTFAQGHEPAQIVGQPFVTWPLPSRVRWSPNLLMQVNVLFMDGGDQITAVGSTLNMQIVSTL